MHVHYENVPTIVLVLRQQGGQQQLLCGSDAQKEMNHVGLKVFLEKIKRVVNALLETARSFIERD